MMFWPNMCPRLRGSPHEPRLWQDDGVYKLTQVPRNCPLLTAGALIPTCWQPEFVFETKVPQCSTLEHLTKRCHARSAEDGRVVSQKAEFSNRKM